MPVQFLTPEQRANYGRYVGDPDADELTRYFHLDDADHAVIGAKRGDHNRLGFALQLTTARFLGTFLEDPIDVPNAVLQTLIRQLKTTNLDQLARYRNADQRWEHTAEIRSRYGFSELANPAVGIRLSRWLYALCWTGTEQPGSCLIVQRPGYSRRAATITQPERWCLTGFYVPLLPKPLFLKAWQFHDHVKVFIILTYKAGHCLTVSFLSMARAN